MPSEAPSEALFRCEFTMTVPAPTAPAPPPPATGAAVAAPPVNASAPLANATVALDDEVPRAAVAACGAAFALDAYGPQALRPEAPGTLDDLADGALALLPDHGVLALTGDDRVRFLHSMSTNDVERQPSGQARWHGLCTAKGRLVATLLGWREPDALMLMLPRVHAETVRKRLAMYVLRAKVRVEQRSDACAVLGLAGARAAAALGALGLPAPGPLEVAGATLPDGAAATVVGLPPIELDGRPSPLLRSLLVVPAASLAALWPALAARLRPLGSDLWRWTEVRGRVVRVVPATSETFVPQMIDFDLAGGVSFDKGCYPGQEVVARAHYLGKVKRHLQLAHVEGGEPAPATGILDASGQAVGAVAMAAPAPGGGADLLIEVQDAALAAAQPLRVDGRPLALEASAAGA